MYNILRRTARFPLRRCSLGSSFVQSDTSIFFKPRSYRSSINVNFNTITNQTIKLLFSYAFFLSLFPLSSSLSRSLLSFSWKHIKNLYTYTTCMVNQVHLVCLFSKDHTVFNVLAIVFYASLSVYYR